MFQPLPAGDICSVTVLGQPLIILNSATAAWEMLDKKSSIYSDRPVLEMGGELVGWKNTLVLLPYGDRFRRYRKLFHQLIGSPYAMSRYWSLEEHQMRDFLRRVIASPDDLSSHIRRFVFFSHKYLHQLILTVDPLGLSSSRLRMATMYRRPTTLLLSSQSAPQSSFPLLPHQEGTS